jgi:hypothetical protein
VEASVLSFVVVPDLTAVPVALVVTLLDVSPVAFATVVI